MRYQVKSGDSPSRIARAYGLPMSALIGANSHKPTHMVANQRTFRELMVRETINVPVGGQLGDSFSLGDPASDVVNLLVAGGGPCLQANVSYVCQIQSILGVTVDGKWGSKTAAAIRALVPGAPGACSPTPAWWAPSGSNKCPGGAVAPAPTASGSSLDRAASNAVAALLGDSNYCASVKRVGTPVNTAIHNFKAAWNAANPGNRVPINTGNYEPSVQAAIASALGTSPSNVPPGCGATAAPVVAPQPSPTTNTAVAPMPPPGFVDPCDPANVAAVCAMQRAAGLTVDGKYGPASAAAARRSDPSAPGPCTPRPGWWAPTGQSNCPGAASPTPSPSPAATVVVPAAVAALASIDPCSQSSLDVVYAAQRALGVSPDGKYGNDTANAARRYLPNAPPACSPRPGWWAPPGTSNTGGGGTVPTPPPRPPEPGPVVVVPVPPPGPPPVPGPGGQPIVVEEKKKISTGAIVAGAIGAVALIGVVAVAMSGKKGARGSRGKRGSRGPARRKSSSRKRR